MATGHQCWIVVVVVVGLILSLMMNHVTGVMEAIHLLRGVSGPMKDLCQVDSMIPTWVSVCMHCVVAGLWEF